LVSAVSWLTDAPMPPRSAATVLMAAVMSVNALFAAAAVLKSDVLKPRLPDDSAVIAVVVLAAPPLVPSLVNTVAPVPPTTPEELNPPRTASLDVAVKTSPATALEITAWPPALRVNAVPALSCPAVTAAVIAVCKVATVSVAPALKTNVPPVFESEMVVVSPDVNAVVASRLP